MIAAGQGWLQRQDATSVFMSCRWQVQRWYLHMQDHADSTASNASRIGVEPHPVNFWSAAGAGALAPRRRRALSQARPMRQPAAGLRRVKAQACACAALHPSPSVQRSCCK